MDDRQRPLFQKRRTVAGCSRTVRQGSRRNCPGRDDLTRQGKSQQDKAEAQRAAAKKEAEAEQARRQRRPLI
jgi:hypothetical protein